MNVAIEPLHVTVPETEPLPLESVKVVPLMVDEPIASLNVTAMLLLIATPVAPLAGLVELTIGAVVSVASVLSEPPPPQAENKATIKKIKATVLQPFISFSSALETGQALCLTLNMLRHV